MVHEVRRFGFGEQKVRQACTREGLVVVEVSVRREAIVGAQRIVGQSVSPVTPRRARRIQSSRMLRRVGARDERQV